jgi:hypothetical protein
METDLVSKMLSFVPSFPSALQLRVSVSLFVRLLPLHLPGMGDPTSSYATAGIALRVSGALKPHHHDKVETPSVGIVLSSFYNTGRWIKCENPAILEYISVILNRSAVSF